MTYKQLVTLSVLGASVAIGCGPSDGDGDGNGTTSDAAPGAGSAADARSGGGAEFQDAAVLKSCSQMDIVFVIDNSPSMWNEQNNLAANFPAFVDELDAFRSSNGDPIDYRISVTTTSVSKSWTQTDTTGPRGQLGDDGALLQRCDMTRRWVDRGDANLRETFACAAQVGVLGAGKEMPLEASLLTFGERMADGTNAGFIRPNALLAIVYLTDEDDCSRRDNNFVVVGDSGNVCDDTQPTQTYVEAMNSFAGGPGRWATAVIAGHDDCDSDFGSATRATRLQQYAAQVGATAVFSTICQGDLATPLSDALATFDVACQNFPVVD